MKVKTNKIEKLKKSDFPKIKLKGGIVCGVIPDLVAICLMQKFVLRSII